MHPAFGQTAPLRGITQAPGIVAAAAITAAAAVVTGDHIIPKEVILTADTAGVAPEGGPIPMTHCNHDHLDNAAISHDPTEGINPTTGVGLNPWGGILAVNPILQIINIPSMLQSLWTGSDVEHIETSILSYEPITSQVAKIVCS